MAIPNFKLTRFYVADKAESEAVQKAMFTLGFKWVISGKGERRKVLPFVDAGGFLYVSNQCRIMYGNSKVNGYTPAFQSALFDAAAEHKLAKKAAKKDSKMRKQGWIKAGVECPVSGDTVVETRFDDGSGSEGKAGDWAWGIGSFYPQYYRVVAPKPTKTLSLRDMVTKVGGWIQHEGGECPVAANTLIDITFRDGTVVTNLKALEETSYRDSAKRFWEHWGEHTSDIIAWRLAKNEPSMYGKTELKLQVVADRVLSIQRAPESLSKPEVDTNPKRQYGMKSVPLNLWSPLASAYGALGLYNGSLKYGQGNYKATPVEASIYIAAAMRHLAAWAEGQEFDPADGVPNLGGVLANIAILIDARAAGTLIDDRQIPGGYVKEMEALKAIVANLQVLHAGKTPRHYSLADAK